MASPTYTAEMILASWQRIKSGETIVCNDYWHDAAIAYFNDQDGDDADRFFRELRTAPNPKRLGVYDGMIAYITDTPKID